MDFNALAISFINVINEMSPYILLGFIIAGLLHVFIPEQTLLRHLSGNGLKTVVKAAAIGIPLPLCSCGVLPTAVGLRRGGASKAATTSFLIATPQTGVDSIAATFSLLGLPFALTRPVAALVCAVAGGFAVGKCDPDPEQKEAPKHAEVPGKDSRPLHHKVIESVRYGFVDMIDSIGKWLVIGLVVATLITVFVPDEWFVGFREFPLGAMLIVVLIAVPMYICATGSIPIAMSLMLKGLTPGVAFVLLMAGPAVNFASIVILNRTQGRKATAIYVASVVVTAIVFGLLIDYCLPAAWFEPRSLAAHDHCHAHFGWFESACSILLALLIAYSALKKLIRRRDFTRAHCNVMDNNLNTPENMNVKEYKISGMNCAHCRASAEKAIAEVAGVEKVSVDLASGMALVEGDASPAAIAEAVRNAGFDLSPL